MGRAMTVSLADQIACVKRELAMRDRAYPKFIAAGRMTQQKADSEIAAMRAVLETLLMPPPPSRRETIEAMAAVADFANAAVRPYALQWSEMAAANGAFHLYLVEETTGRKIGAIWGHGDEKADTGALIVEAVNNYTALPPQFPDRQ
jgi:hypothetical protein